MDSKKTFNMSSNWRAILRENFTNLKDLAAFLELTDEQIKTLDEIPNFPLNLPRKLASKIEKGSLSDPIFLQFIPLKKELTASDNFGSNPLKEDIFTKESKLLTKYNGRALIISTSACAMNCRFCFRKNFPYEIERKNFDNEINYIQRNESIEEVILSGGDPLSLSNETLNSLITSITDIKHIKRVRFHTRFPMGIPERIDDGFLEILSNCPKQVWFIIHANHPNEFDADIIEALKKIQKLAIPVLHQAVLLQGVNNSIETLYALYSLLINHGISPYYLHNLDKVTGSSHFEVPLDEGKALVEELQKKLSGFGVPRFVQEIPGSLSKTPL